MWNIDTESQVLVSNFEINRAATRGSNQRLTFDCTFAPVLTCAILENKVAQLKILF